ncbi:hypothetical protein HDU87_003508 [Geranomyces variabilis]|uniref:Uncharacterized protein n=1 Tax=Geranomyces variabilis TaxID=109894 RepID=A0AAD5TLZ0_9FUNG|nr:hypothetical protein HDU87_003508 [Geranomyces variabilis]
MENNTSSEDDDDDDDDDYESEKENDVASLRARSPLKKQPHHRPSSAPITGAGAGIPSDEVAMQPWNYARPAVHLEAAESSAAWAARLAGINLNNGEGSKAGNLSTLQHQQAPPPPPPPPRASSSSSSYSYPAAPPPTPAPAAPPRATLSVSSLPPPSHNSRATAFSIAKWVERTTASRPRSAPASRFAAPEALQSSPQAGAAAAAATLKRTPAPLLPSKHTLKHPVIISGPTSRPFPPPPLPPPSSPSHPAVPPTSSSSLEILTPRQGGGGGGGAAGTRATTTARPASAPSASFRAGGAHHGGGLLVGRAHPRLDKLHKGRLVGIAVSGRHI